LVAIGAVRTKLTEKCGCQRENGQRWTRRWVCRYVVKVAGMWCEKGNSVYLLLRGSLVVVVGEKVRGKEKRESAGSI